MVLLDWLARKFPNAKKTTLRRMLHAGRVLVNGQPARRAKDPISEKDRVEVLERGPEPIAPAGASGGAGKAGKGAVRPPFEILHEDEDVIVVLKPPGILTSTGQRERRATVKQMLWDYVSRHRPRAVVGAIHRLDRDASGLLVFSLNNDAYRKLKRQFFHHTVDRVYTAVVEGRVTPAEGTIQNRLIERADGRVVPAKKAGEGDEAVTHYQTLATRRIGEDPKKKTEARRRTISLLKVTLQTGRKHQIRAQFAARSNPVLNDPLYNEEEPAGRLLLAATQLSFDHPRTGQRMSFQIRPPKEIVKLFPEATGSAEA